DIARAHGSYEALLQDTTVDAIYIPLPNSLHVEWAVRAVGHGKHVLCEKPLATTVSGVDIVRDAASKAGVRVAEALMYRFHPQTVQMLELIKAGYLGEIQLVTASFSYGLHNPRDIRLQSALG